MNRLSRLVSQFKTATIDLASFGGGLEVYEWDCDRCGIRSEPFLSIPAREADLAAHVFEMHSEAQ